MKKPPPPAPKGNQYAKGNRGGGRPSAFKREWTPIAELLGELGATDEQIGKCFGVGASAIKMWRLRNPVFCAAVKRGKEVADNAVVQSLFHRALGYSHADIDIRSVAVGGGVSRIVKTPVTKHYPPDPTSCIFWLKNRVPAQWRERLEQILQNPDGTALAPVGVKVVVANVGAKGNGDGQTNVQVQEAVAQGNGGADRR